MTFWFGFFCGLVALPGLGWCLVAGWYTWRVWKHRRRQPA